MASDRDPNPSPAQTPAPTPPPAPAPIVVRGARRPLTLVTCGVVLAGLILVVVMNLDRDEVEQPAAWYDGDVTELVEPAPLTAEEIAEQSNPRVRSTFDAALGNMPAGGWIQIADQAGELAQQYRFERLDPDPEGLGAGWFRMLEPEFEVYLSDGRVVSLTGDTALAHTPNRAVESGTITGNVLIRLYEDLHGATLDPARDVPSLLVRTGEASFDNIIGEVRCAGAIHLETKGGAFDGRGLRLQINDEEQVIQRLDVQEVDQIRLATHRAERTPGPGGPTAGERAGDSEREVAPVGAGTRGGREGERETEIATETGTETETEIATETEIERAAPVVAAQFYLLTLHDNVRIRQGEGDAQRTSTGDDLYIIFTSESEGLGAALAVVPAPPAFAAHAAPPAGPGRIGPRRLPEFIAGLALAAFPVPPTIVAPPGPGDTFVTCTGGLTMVPLRDESRFLPSPKDARLELVGAPVRLDDPAGAAQATCAMLAYDVRQDELELLGSERHELNIASPELVATARRFWLRESAGRGGFTGLGEARFSDSPEQLAGGGPARDPADRERMRITWIEGLDLEFDSGDPSGRLGALRRAEFRGGVYARGRDLRFTEAGPDPLGGTPKPGDEGTPGSLLCDRLEIAFDPSGDPAGTGGLAPKRLLATGNVRASDDTQTLLARSLEVTFAPPAAPPPGAGMPADAGTTDVQRVVAEADVRLVLADGPRVAADHLDIDVPLRTAELTGRNVVIVDGNNYIDRAERITVHDREQRYVLHGPGRFRRFDLPVLDGAPDPLGTAPLEVPPDRTEELRVTWEDGVYIGPGDERDEGAAAVARAERAGGPGLARFTGNVTVTSPDLKLTHADEMVVRFARAEGEGATRTIESVDARGGVHARSTGNPGAISSEHLHVEVARTERGETVPRRLEATGEVHVADPEQELFADALTVTFVPRADVLETGGAAPPPASGDFAGARVAVDRVEAVGAVQIRLAGGELAFADRLVGNGVDETAELHGQRVLVLGREFVLDRGRRLLVNKRTGRYRSEGPGIFHAFARPIELPPAGGRIDPPQLDAEPWTTEAIWSESAEYVEIAPGRSSLELHGEVRAESRPNPLELNTVDADVLVLEFVELPGTGSASARRDLASLSARSDEASGAKLENRTWRADDETLPPRVFHVRGRQVDFDQRTMEAFVEGAGELLIRDEWTSGTDEGAGPPPGPLGGFGARGTSLLRWKEKLHMTRAFEDLFTIVMTGDVECVQRSVDGSISTLTGQWIETVIARDAPAGVEPDAAADGAIRFGGAMKPRRVRGRGGIVVRTPERDVTCDEFDYNVATGLAEAKAAPGRLVYIFNRNAEEPMRHERLLWNMSTGTITIYRGGASGAP